MLINVTFVFNLFQLSLQGFWSLTEELTYLSMYVLSKNVSKAEMKSILLQCQEGELFFIIIYQHTNDYYKN